MTLESKNMVARVARAIFETWAADGNTDATWDELLRMQEGDGYQAAKQTYALALKEARAAIGAMREPTDAMKVAGGIAIEQAAFEDGKLVFEAAGDAFRAMISASLNKQVAP